MLIAFNKPFGVISQFTGDGSGNRPLAEFGFPKNVYSLGRLDAGDAMPGRLHFWRDYSKLLSHQCIEQSAFTCVWLSKNIYKS